MTTWQCAACPANSTVSENDLGAKNSRTSRFASIKEFSEHLKAFHVLVKNVNGSTVYICRYGPSGACSAQSLNPDHTRSGVFNSLHDYERHLLSCHLKHAASASSYSNGLLKSSMDSISSPSNSRWSVFHSVVNLPAVLNDPTYRQTDIFARTWGEQFERAEVLPSPRLPIITEKHFERYLKKLRSTGVSHSSAPHSDHQAPTENVVLKAVRSTTPSRKFPSINQVIVSEDLPTARASTLSSVPSMYFDSEFNLKQPQTFSRVIPLHHRSVKPASLSAVSFVKPFDFDNETPHQIVVGDKQEQDFRAQHDRLTQYLDIVEVHLAEQVSKKSSIFFEAVCCHDVVQEQLKTALEHIKLVRNKLGQVDSSVTNGVMKLHRIVRRRANYRLLLERLKIIASLQTAQPTIQLLLRSSDFCAALDLVSSTQELLQQFTCDQSGLSSAEPNPANSESVSAALSASRQITCLRHVHAQLVEISRFVRHMIGAEFEEALRQFLASRSTGNEYLGPDLVPCLLGLLHIKRYDFVSAFRAELLRQIKLLQTNRAGSVAAEPTPSLSLKEKLRTMSNAEWIDLVANRCSDLRDLLSRAKEATQIFSQVVQRSTTVPPIDPHALIPPLSQQTARELHEQVTVAMQTACGAAQKHVVDLVSLRNRLTVTESSPPNTVSNEASTKKNNAAKPHCPPVVGGESALDRLHSNEFIHLVSVLQGFQEFLLNLLGETEYSFDTSDHTIVSKTTADTISNSTTVLARLLLFLTRNSIQRFHQERTTKLDMILNQERWQSVPVPNRVQDLVDRTFVEALRNGKKSSSDSHCSPNGICLSTLDSRQTQPTSDDSVASSLSLDGERFVVVGTVLLLLPMVVDYVNLAPQLPCRPGSVAELGSRLAELLNSFNSRTCQLVLGAEARKAADLPTISARNLALASRSVQLISRCIPSLQTFFENLINSTPETDHVIHSLYAVPKDKRLHDPLKQIGEFFKEHVDQIGDKLFSLLSSRIQDRLCAWSVRPPTPSPEIRAICRSLTRMVEMISDVMPSDMLTSIILRAHSEFKAQLRHRLTELNVTADGGPMQSLVDLELTFYAKELHALTPNLSNFEEDFSDVWPSN